jgi:hypothetical protein
MTTRATRPLHVRRLPLNKDADSVALVSALREVVPLASYTVEQVAPGDWTAFA